MPLAQSPKTLRDSLVNFDLCTHVKPPLLRQCPVNNLGSTPIFLHHLFNNLLICPAVSGNLSSPSLTKNSGSSGAAGTMHNILFIQCCKQICFTCEGTSGASTTLFLYYMVLFHLILSIQYPSFIIKSDLVRFLSGWNLLQLIWAKLDTLSTSENPMIRATQVTALSS